MADAASFQVSINTPLPRPLIQKESPLNEPLSLTLIFLVKSFLLMGLTDALTTTCSASLSNNTPSSDNSSPAPAVVIVSPCAACKILRRRCTDKCVLAPYFPPTEPHKFTIAHRVFGASNIIKFLQDLPESRRADAVSSMVYEAGARVRDPIYGCAGTICQLQKQVSELQAQLAKAQAEIVTMQSHQAQLVALVRMVEMTQSSPQSSPEPSYSDKFIGSPPNAQGNLCNLFEDHRQICCSVWDILGPCQ